MDVKLRVVLIADVNCKRPFSSYWMITQFGSRATRGSLGNKNFLGSASWASTCTPIRTNERISSPNLPSTTIQQTVVGTGTCKMGRHLRTRSAWRRFGSNPVPISLFGSVTSDAMVVHRTATHKPNIRTTMDGTGCSSMTMFLTVTGPATKSSSSTQTRFFASLTKTRRALSVYFAATMRCNSSLAEIIMESTQNFSSTSSALQSSRNTSSWPR